jgi:hypothetical protein
VFTLQRPPAGDELSGAAAGQAAGFNPHVGMVARPDELGKLECPSTQEKGCLSDLRSAAATGTRRPRDKWFRQDKRYRFAKRLRAHSIPWPVHCKLLHQLG